MSEIETLRKQLDQIEAKYNTLLEQLQQIADVQGDNASADPVYIQTYEEASRLNAEFETLQAKLASLEAAVAAAPPVPAIPADVEAVAPMEGMNASVAGAIDALDSLDGQAPAGVAISPAEATTAIQAPVPAIAASGITTPGATPEPPVAATPEVAVEPATVAPPTPKYVTVERTRVEIETLHQQSWVFVGIASNVSPAVQDLASKGGYVSENVLEKKFGKITLLCPFEVDFPIGGLISANARRTGAGAGLIYFPQASPSPQATATLGQLLQQFLAPGAPRGHVVGFLKVNKVESGDDKASVIVGGLTEQDGRILQGLKRVGNVFSDNGIFFKGQLLDDVKSMATKLGLRLVTIVCTSNVIQNQEKLQALVESF